MCEVTAKSNATISFLSARQITEVYLRFKKIDKKIDIHEETCEKGD